MFKKFTSIKVYLGSLIFMTFSSFIGCNQQEIKGIAIDLDAKSLHVTDSFAVGYGKNLEDSKNPFANKDKNKTGNLPESFRKELDVSGEAKIKFEKLLNFILDFVKDIPEAQSEAFQTILEELKGAMQDGSGYSDKIGIIKKLFDELLDLDQGNPKVMSKFTERLKQILEKIPENIPELARRKEVLIKLLETPGQPRDSKDIAEQVKGIFLYGQSADISRQKEGANAKMGSIEDEQMKSLIESLKSSLSSFGPNLPKDLEKIVGNTAVYPQEASKISEDIKTKINEAYFKEGFEFIKTKIQNNKQIRGIFNKISVNINEAFLVKLNKHIQYSITNYLALHGKGNNVVFGMKSSGDSWSAFSPKSALEVYNGATSKDIVKNNKVAGGTIIFGYVDLEISVRGLKKEAKKVPSLLQLNCDIEVDSSNKPIKDYENCITIYNALTIDLKQDGEINSSRVSLKMGLKKGDWTPVEGKDE